MRTLLVVALHLAVLAGAQEPSDIPRAALVTLVPTPDGVRETRRYERYVIHGATTEALATQMEALGPQHGTDEIAPALTRSERGASLTYQSDAKACRISGVTVTLNVTIILPVWDIPRDASAALRAEWDRFLGALERHELGHRAIALDGAHKLADALSRLRGRTCDALHTAAEYASRDEAAATRAEQIAYDDSTRHGLLQGTALSSVR
jgi:predicted secreted Zn-dependent protease